MMGRQWILVVMLVFTMAAWAAEPDYAKYPYDTAGRAVDFGVQPLAYPIAMVSELMRHDQILKGHLARSGKELRQHAYAKGADMLDFLSQDRLEVFALGDLPMITAALRNDVLIIGLLKQGYSSVVARRPMPLVELKGKRIAYGFGSTAHYTLLEALSSAGLTEKDVALVQMNINDMPNALDKGEVDAFSSWEPAPTVALARNPNHAVVYRGLNTTYLGISRRYAKQYPEEARHLLAAVTRAIYWMQQSRKHLEQAAKWALAAEQAFSGRLPNLTVEQAMTVTRRELLDVAAMPLIPRLATTEQGLFFKQVEFLKKIGKLEAGAQWGRLRESIDRTLFNEVTVNPAQYGLYHFNYQ
jgi:NitT/TauT family transport system substrate-binding protein